MFARSMRWSAIAAALTLASTASAQTVITFEEVPPGTLLTDQYPDVTFSSSPGNSNYAHPFIAGNILCTGPTGGTITCVPDTYMDFTTPVSDLRFQAIEPNGSGVVAQFRIFENGVLAATEDLIGLGGGSGTIAVDLTAYSDVTRLEIVNILDDPVTRNGIGWDTLMFTAAPTSPFYCTAKTNSLGCTPLIGFTGVLSASAGSGCDIVASSVLSNKNGLLFYGTNGPSVTPFGGGFLCVAATLSRTGMVQNSGGGPVLDCNGAYSRDFNAYIASGVDPLLIAGQTVWFQYFSRDPGFSPPDNIGLTGGLELTIGP